MKLSFNPKLFSKVEENFCYLERIGNIFFCKLCSVCFPVEPILNLNYPEGGKLKTSLQKEFSKHLDSLDHSAAVKSNVNNEKFCTDVSKREINCTETNTGIEFCTSILSACKDIIKPKFKTYDPIMNEVTVTVYTAYNRICDIFKSKIPDIIVRNIGYLVMKNCESFMCLICAAQLMVKDDAVDMENVFSQHLEGLNHKHNLKIYLESLPNEPRLLLCMLKPFLKSNKVYRSLRRIFGSIIPNIIYINKTVLSKYKRGFICKLCGDLITFKKDKNHAILQFSIHLESKKHYKKCENLRDDLVKFEKYVLGAFRRKRFSVLKNGRTLTNWTSSGVDKTSPISFKLCSKPYKILESSGEKTLPFTVKNNSTINSGFTCEPPFVASNENENFPSDTNKNTVKRRNVTSSC